MHFDTPNTGKRFETEKDSISQTFGRSGGENKKVFLSFDTYNDPAFLAEGNHGFTID